MEDEDIGMSVEEVVSPSPGKGEVLQRQGFTFSLINVAVLVEYFNLQFLFSSMRGLEMSLGFSPEMLSRFTMVEELSLVSFIPVWGFLSDLFEMKYVLMLALLLSGILSIVLGTISNYGVMLVIRIFNGATMGSVTPTTQSYVARMTIIGFGLAFGIIHSVASAARFICSVVVTYFSSKVYSNVYGWRICSFIFGSFCILASPLLLLMPSFNKPKGAKDSASRSGPLSYFLTNLRESFSTKTSGLILLLFYFTDGPFVAFSFFTLYLQYLGLSDLKAGVFTGLVIIGCLVGGVLGGITTDYCHKKSPKYGRIGFGIACTVTRSLIIFILLCFVTRENVKHTQVLAGILLFIIGMSFVTTASVDRSTLVEVTMPKYQSAAVSISRCIAGVGSSLTFAPMLGILTERVYGYEPIRVPLSEAPIELVERNIKALRKALLIVINTTNAVTVILYFLACFTFASDAEHIRKRVKLELEGTSKVGEKNESQA